MENRKVSIIIKVNDMEGCRRFYRTLLNLCEPMLNSNFQAVFNLSNSCELILEKSSAKYLERFSTSILWHIEVESIDEMLSRLKEAKYATNFELVQHGMITCYRGNDPEGNIFFVSEKIANNWNGE